jgi:hypothetical protein
MEATLKSQPDWNGNDATSRGVVSILPSEKSRQLAHLQVKASQKLSKDFRELALQFRES